MKTGKRLLAAVLAALLLCGTVLADTGFNAGLTIDRDTEGQISVTVQDSDVLAEKKPTLTIDCDYAYAKVTAPDGSVAYYTGTGTKMSFTVSMGGTYVLESISELPKQDSGSTGGSTGSAGSGSTTTVKKDPVTGETTTTVTTKDGVTGTTVTDQNGNVTALSAAVSASAAAGGEIVTLPVEVPVVTDSSSAVEIEITVPASAGTVKVELPTQRVSSGLVAVIVADDGTETVVRNCTVSDTGVVVELSGSATVKIIDNSTDFEDVTDHNWYADAVDFVSARGLFGGVSSTGAVFDGEGTMTRGMLAVVLYRLEYEPKTAGEGDFDDVPADTWYTGAVAWAAQSGVVTGYGGSFAPEDEITREQLAVMLWRYAGSPESSHSLVSCPDAASVSDYAVQAMAWAHEKGIISGMGGGVLKPQGSATRAQVAQMLKNFLENT